MQFFFMHNIVAGFVQNRRLFPARQAVGIEVSFTQIPGEIVLKCLAFHHTGDESRNLFGVIAFLSKFQFSQYGVEFHT